MSARGRQERLRAFMEKDGQDVTREDEILWEMEALQEELAALKAVEGLDLDCLLEGAGLDERMEDAAKLLDALSSRVHPSAIGWLGVMWLVLLEERGMPMDRFEVTQTLTRAGYVGCQHCSEVWGGE